VSGKTPDRKTTLRPPGRRVKKTVEQSAGSNGISEVQKGWVGRSVGYVGGNKKYVGKKEGRRHVER